MELDKLQNDIENILYTTFLNSKVIEWLGENRKNHFKYTYDNMSFIINING